MRVHILSDLHLEFAGFTPPAVDADVVVLAGDVCPGTRGMEWALEAFSNRPVVYVPGNHEYYGQTAQKLLNELRQLARGSHVHLLDHDSVTIGGVTFCGATLWTDFALNGDPVFSEIVAQTGMSDYRRIRTLSDYSKLRPSETRVWHSRALRWLEEQANSLREQKLVIVTHHAPSPQSIIPGLEGDALNPAYTSDLRRFVSVCNARLWIHGHIHLHHDYQLGNTHVIANPRGYPTESHTGFDPAFVVEV